MKKLLLFTLAAGLLFVACKKDEENENTENTDTTTTVVDTTDNNTSTSGDTTTTDTTTTDTTTTGGNNGGTTVPTGYYVTATVNGESFVSKDDDLFEYYKIQFGSHQLTGKKDDTESINLWFWNMDPVAVGTYDLTDESTHKVTATYLTVNPYDTYSCEANKKDQGATGTVTVTSSDGVTMEGTFEYTAVNNAGDKITVTNGKFRLTTN